MRLFYLFILLTLLFPNLVFGGDKEYSQRVDRVAMSNTSVLTVEVPVSNSTFTFGLNESKNTGVVKLIYTRENQSDLVYSVPWKYKVTVKDINTNNLYTLEVNSGDLEGDYSDYQTIGLGLSVLSNLNNSLSILRTVDAISIIR